MTTLYPKRLQNLSTKKPSLSQGVARVFVLFSLCVWWVSHRGKVSFSTICYTQKVNFTFWAAYYHSIKSQDTVSLQDSTDISSSDFQANQLMQRLTSWLLARRGRVLSSRSQDLGKATAKSKQKRHKTGFY